MKETQIAEVLYLLGSPGNMLQEAQVEGILEATLKRDLKDGWTLEIIHELLVRHEESC